MKRDIIYYDQIIGYSDHLEYSLNSLRALAAIARKDFENQLKSYKQTLEALDHQGLVTITDSKKFHAECEEQLPELQRKKLL